MSVSYTEDEYSMIKNSSHNTAVQENTKQSRSSHIPQPAINESNSTSLGVSQENNFYFGWLLMSNNNYNFG